MQNEIPNYLPYVLKFDGQDDHIVLPEMKIDYSQGFTIEAWVFYNSFKNASRVIDFGNGPSKNNIVFGYILNGTNALVLDIKKGSTSQQIVAEKALEIGKWMHLAATIDASGNGKLYKNGQEIQAGTIQLPPNVNRSINYIARSNWANDPYFDGKIAEVRLWNRARTAEELQNDLHRRLEGKVVGLVGYWPLNEGTGDTVSKTGKINGSTWYNEIFFPTKDPFAYPQNLLSFQGKFGYVEIKDPFDNNKEFTISLWVKPSIINDGDSHGLIGKQGDKYRKPGVWLTASKGGLLYDSYDPAGKRYSEQLDNFFQVKDKWVHITWLKQGSEYRIYRNGELFATKPAPETFYTQNDTTYWIGKVDSFWAGEIAEVSIWNRARTIDEIETDMYRHLEGKEAGLVGYWPCDDFSGATATVGSGDTAKDKTSRSNNGKVYSTNWGTQTTIKSPQVTGHLQTVPLFNGQDNYITVADNPSLQIGTYTVEIWIRPSQFTKEEVVGIMGKPGRNFNIWLTNTGYIHHRFHTSKSTNAGAPDTPNGSISWNQWHHVAITNDGKTAKTYINGKLMAEGAIDGSLVVDKTPLYIGRDLDGNNQRYFNGQLGDVRVWSIARTQAEIEKNMHRLLTGSEAGLVGYWPLNEGSGDIANDKTKNGNQGQISGAMWSPNVSQTPGERSLDLKSLLSFRLDCIQIQDPFENNQEFTISLWVKPSVLNDGGWHGLIGYDKDLYRKPGLWLAPNNSALHYDSYDAAGKRYDAALEKFFEAKDKWVHITWVKQGTEYKFYRNGELFDTKPAPETVYTKSDTNYWIGKVDNFWQGEIAEVAVWNYARSPVEIKEAVYDRLFGVELGLVGYWPLNDGFGDTAKDKTARANNGIINQATWGQQYFLKPVDRVLWNQQYLSLPCLNFNGKNSYVEVPAHTNPTDAITVSVWVKSNTPNWNESGCLIEKQNAYSLHPEAGGKRIVFSIYIGGLKSLSIMPNVDITQWHHYAGTFDGKVTRFYINGEEVAQLTNTAGKIDASNSPLYIGKDLNSTKYFNGTVAEIQVWDKALTQPEIQIYMFANPAKEPGLVGYWPLHEGTGDMATNLAKNDEAGKITKATWERQIFNKFGLISSENVTGIKNEKIIKTALYFDGQNDHIVLPEMNVDYAQGFTVEAWVYYNSFKSWSRIIDFFNLPSNTDKIVFANVESKDTLALDIKRGKTEQRITADNALETGKWMHLAATVDASGNGKLYKNGQEIKSGKMHLPESLNRTQNYIGKSHGSGDAYFDGRIAEVRVWNRARKAEELQQDMHRRLAGNEAGLVGYWPLNEGSENRVFDKTRNGKNGRIDGAIWPQISRSNYLQSVFSSEKHYFVNLSDPFRQSTAKNNEQFTISFWVKPSVLNDGNFYGLMGFYVKPCLFVGPNNNALYFTIPSGNTENAFKPKNIYAEFLDNFFEAPDKWVHIAWVNRGKELNFYRNGELFATKPTPEDFHRRSIGADYYLGLITTGSLALGFPELERTRNHKKLLGHISDLSFWDRACSLEEIKANMHRRLVGNEAGLLGYWPLDEGSGDRIYNRVNPGYGIGLRIISPDMWEEQLFFVNEVLGDPKPLEVEQQISEEEKKTSELQQKIAQLEKQISEQKQKIAEVEQQNSQQTQKVTQLEQQNSQQAQKVTQLEQQNSEQAKKVTQLEQQNSQQAQKITQLEQQNSQQAQKVTQLEQQNSEQAKKVTELEQQNSQQAQKVTQLEQQNSQQAQKVTQLEQQNSQQAQKVTQLEQQNSQQAQKVTEIEQQNSQQAQKVAELEQQNSQQAQKVAELEQQNSQQAQKVTQLEQENSEQAQKILELEKKNLEMSQENSQLKQKNSEQKKKNSELSKKISEQEQKNSQLEKENYQLKQNNSEPDRKIADRDKKISELEQKIAELEKKNSGLEEQEQLGVTPKNGCQEVQKLQPMDLKSESYFGEEVAISGEWAIAGSRKADGSGVQDAGIAYIFQLQDRKWQQKQLLQPIDLRVSDQFGCAVAIRGEWAIVGAHKADASGIQDAGSAYVFRLENGVWQQKQKLQATGLGANSYFGKGIAISGDWAIVGASHSQAFDVANAGAAYVFRLENGVWQQKQRLQPVDLGVNQCFGNSIAMSGEYVFIGGGDRYASAGIKRPGGVYIYRLENGVWQQVQKLPSPQPDDNDLFGYSVAVSGKYAFVGAVNTIVSHISSAGTVYAYQLENGVWQLKQKLQPNNPDYCSFFGASVFMSGEVAVVGSTRADSINIKDTGAAYLFHLENGVWQQKQKLQPSDLHYESYFGFCTAIDREWIFVTASWADTPNFRRVGATYIFQVQ